MMINPLVRIVTLLVIAAFSHFTKATAQAPVIVPDLTKGAKIPTDSRHDWNLGPTGLRGWIFCDRLVTTDARQILITKVDKGSPASDIFRVGDVILGVGGKPFSFDPRTELGKAITTAETKTGGGKLALTRWRAGKSDEVVLNLRVIGSYGETAPSDCDKSKLLLEQGCKSLAARMSQPYYTKMDSIPRSLNAIALLASGDQACARYARQQNPWESQIRTPELMQILLSYGTHAKAVVPELTTLANYFEKDEPDFPEELMKQKANSVRDTIRAIEATAETPKLIRLNQEPEAKEPEAKQQKANGPGGDSAKAPLKVFILAGQSNMEGHAEIRTFDYIGKDPATAPLLKEMRNPDGMPRVCDNVWMSYLTGPYDGSANGEGLGKLTAGFGARGDQPTKDGGKIGPEFTFGITMEKELKEPILIIKTAWGGRSLNTEFRPPNAGPYVLPKQIQDEWDKHPQGAHGIPKLEDRKKWQEDKNAASGVFYRMMVEHVKKVLADPARVCPAYDSQVGYELAGFVWLQGFNDLVDGQTYPNGEYDEYSRLLAHFIRDVRKDLTAPKMPFVIGVLGVDGEKNFNFRKAMAAPAAMPEFKGNVVAVDTAPFWDHDIEAAEPKQGQYNEIVGTAHTLKADGTLDTQRKWDKFWKPIGKPLPQERNWRFVTIDATETKDKLEEFTDRRFRDIRLPAGMENWYMPDFDDSQWTASKAPIGKGVWNHSGVTLDKYSSMWGREEFLLMRSTFEADNLDCDSYRIAILARQGFHVYLNGHKIHTYIWWQDKPQYRSIVLDKEQTQYLKRGKNVLAVYANDQYSPDSPRHYAALDAWIEGITKADHEKFDLALEEVLSPKDREALAGASNGGYHYFGSAKIFAQMGKAFAEANLKLINK